MNKLVVTRRSRTIRPALVALAALVVGGMLGLGISAPAFAVSPTAVQVTIKVVNKAGVAVPTSAIAALQDVSGVEPYGDVPVDATTVAGKPGYFTASLVEGDSYTLEIDPTGASANNGDSEYLGGAQDFTQAETFVPSATNTFVTATFAAEGEITGKVTSPTGIALKKAEAESFVFDGGQWVPTSDEITDASGVYTMTDLQPGSYVIKFLSPTDAYPPVYSGGGTTLDAATPVSVQPNKPATANAKFSTFTGSISGAALVDFDGRLYPDEQAIASAYPVLTQSGGHAATLDYGHAVSSAPANSRGAWAIGNLAPGTYLVNIEPAYYNEADQWVGATDPSESAASATVFTVATGQKVAAGTTELLGMDSNDTDQNGAQPNVFVSDIHSDGVQGAFVSITSDEDGFEYVSGVSGDDPLEETQLTYSNGSAVDFNLQPAWYTVTVVSPSGLYEPYSQEQYLDFDQDNINVVLQDVTISPSFSSPPAIAQTSLEVGTTYTVTGQAAARPDATLSYQWLRNGSPIYDAAGTSYTSTGADLGAQVAVRVTASSFGFGPASTAVNVQGGVETPGPAPTNTGDVPSITPTTGAFVGTTLQAHVGGWSATGLKFHYQWTSGTDIVGTGSSTYVVAARDIDKPITVTVTATKTGNDVSDAVASPAAVTPAAHPAPLNTKAPVVTKTVSKGVTAWSTTAGTWSVAGLTYHYDWSVAGTDMSITSKYVTPTPASTDPLELTVSATKDGYLPGKKTLIVQKGTSAFTETSLPHVVDGRTSTSPAASDPVEVGDSLSVAATANWQVDGSIAPDSYSYQWYRTAVGKLPVAISGATKDSYTVASTDVNEFLSVRETAVSATYTSASVFADAGFGAVSTALVDAPAMAAVRGVAAQGQVLSALVSAWPTIGVTNSYQWLECPTTSVACSSDDPTTYLAISKQTKSTLTVASSYGNIAVRVTGSKAGYSSETIYSGLAATNPADDIVALSNPTISGLVNGQAKIGVKLTAVSGKYSVSGLKVSYSWFSCLPGVGCDMDALNRISYGNTFVPDPGWDGTGAELEVIEYVTRSGYTQDSQGDLSQRVTFAPGTMSIVKAPTIVTSPTSFEIATGTYTQVGGNSTGLSWFVDGTGVTDGEGQQWTYQRSDADTGKAIWATVTYNAEGYNDIVTTLVAQKGTLTANPESLAGALYGDRLGLSFATPFTDAAGLPITLNYQWYSNNVAIKGATAATFTPSTAYIGHHIQVKVTGSSSLYNVSSITTASTFVLGTGGLGALSQPTISYTGALEPGTVMMSVLGSGYDTTEYTVARQWQKSTNGGTTWVSISKATAVTYTPAATDVGAQFRVQIVSSKAGYGTQSQWSEPVTVQYSPTLATLTPPVVTGTATVGSTLTANPGTWNTPTLTYTYQWYRDDVFIPGATASTFVPDYTDATDTLSFTVTASRVGYQPVTVTSNDQVIGPGTITDTTAPKITLVSGKYSVSTGAWAVDGLTFGYQWQVAGVDATGTGAMTDTYTRVPSDTGVLRVVVTVRRTGYTPLTLIVNGPTLQPLP